MVAQVRPSHILTSGGFEKLDFQAEMDSEQKIRLYHLKDPTQEKIENATRAILREQQDKNRTYGGKLESFSLEILEKPYLCKRGNHLELVSYERVLEIQREATPLLTMIRGNIKNPTPKKPSQEEVDYYALAQKYAEKRALNSESDSIPDLGLSEEETKRFWQYIQQYQQHEFILSGKLKEVEGDCLHIEFEHTYDNPILKLPVLIALQALRENDIPLAQKILHHLHQLDIEEYLIVSAQENIEKQDWVNAERHYHALTLMHPFYGHYYIQRAGILSEMGEFKKSMEVCQLALRKVNDPVEKKLLQYKIVMNLFRVEKDLEPKEATQVLTLLFEMVEIGAKLKNTDPCLLEVTFNLFARFNTMIGYSDEASFRNLFGLTQKLLILTDSFDLSHETVRKIRQQLAEQLMKLLCAPLITVDDTIQQYILSMAHSFYLYPAVMKMFTNWSLINRRPELVVEFYEEHPDAQKPETLACLYLAKALVAVNNSAPPNVVKGFLLQSYEHEQASYSAFNLGSFLLRIEPQLASQYFEIAVGKEGSNSDHFLYLWASQVLIGETDKAQGTLERLRSAYSDLSNIHTTIQKCYTFQKNHPSPSCNDILRCAGLMEDIDIKEEVTKKPIPPVIPKEIEEWIFSKQVTLCDGYIGMPISQRNADRLPKRLEGHYSTELQNKLKENESITLPLPNQDCWIGTKGKNDIPRVDIELHAPKGNAPDFQRFRFQQGPKKTYGGLWLPIGQPLSKAVILQAYQSWIQNELAYLVVFHPGSCSDVGKIYEEIYQMAKTPHG